LTHMVGGSIGVDLNLIYPLFLKSKFTGRWLSIEVLRTQ
jgi:hypothetical protein